MRRVCIIAASAVLACLVGVAVVRIDSGATSGPSAGEKAVAGGDVRSEAATTTTTGATVPAAGPGSPAPTTASPPPPPPPPPPVTSPTTAGRGGRAEGPPIGQPQVWSLPQGKLDINDELERNVYNAFVDGCDAGGDALESDWEHLRSPRNDFLFTAALHVCRGDTDGGRRWFETGAVLYGGEYANWGGVGGSAPSCLTYKAVRSVLDNVPQASVTCPAAVPGPPNAGGPLWCQGQERVRPTTLDRIEPCPEPDTASAATAAEG